MFTTAADELLPDIEGPFHPTSSLFVCQKLFIFII